MKENDKAISALLAVFPSHEIFVEFAKDGGNFRTIESFIAYANRNGIFDGQGRKALETFIRLHARPSEERKVPSGLNFETLLDKKKNLLRLSMSFRGLTDRINVLMKESGIDLPKVSNSMLTRLKNEPADTVHKQNVLRSLAFWLGHERSETGRTWNYETLLKLCNTAKPQEHYREGIRIGFALYGRGDVIDHEIVGWLRKAIRTFTERPADGSPHSRWGKIRPHDITTIYIDSPKEERGDDPASFRLCLRNAVSLAHHIAIRWALSKYSSKNRFLSIGIVAGDYAVLDNYLLPILNARLPGDPVIRVSDYVRQCLLINDIRVILCQKPYETALFNGEALNIWWIVALWSSLYFDFIPDLLEDKILNDDPSSDGHLTNLLWFTEEMQEEAGENEKPNAITTFFKFPHNSLLGVEIAKTLYYRRQFEEAIEILRVVLSIDPADLVARSLRMVLYRNLAAESHSPATAEYLFNQAEHEGLYIQENCEIRSEDFYCEYAAIYLVKAMLTLRTLRHGNGFCEGRTMKLSKEEIFLDLDKAEYLFEMAMSISPSVIRSFFLLECTRVLKAVLKADEAIFLQPDRPIDAPPQIVRRCSANMNWHMSLARKGFSEQRQSDFIEKMMIRGFAVHDDSISLKAYRPATYFCHAVSLWDFMPVRSVRTAKRVIWLLSRAIEMARCLKEADVCIYSYTRNYGEMMQPDEFIRDAERSIRMVENTAGKDLWERDDREVIKPDAKRLSLLMTLNF